jgi:energy-coupling factor transporter transmembrane protein EcfT
MAELTSFSYISGDSPLHRMDARFKIILIILLSLVSLNLYFVELGILTVLLFGMIVNARLPLKAGFREVRYFLLLLFFVFVARVLSTGGPALINLKIVTISIQGLYDGILVCWRLAFIMILGFAFIATTRPSAIKAAAQWFLKPFPFIPEKKVAVMMGLILRFVPVIFDQARETQEAQKARGIENRKNPVYRLSKLGFPLLRRTFERADELAAAMEARGFSENRTDPELACHKRDWIALMVVSCLCVLMLIVS